MQEQDRRQAEQRARQLINEMDRLERELDHVSPWSRPATRDEQHDIDRLFMEIGRVAEVYGEVWQYGPEPRHPCPCCHLYTLEAEPPGTYEICRVCWWQDDPVQFHKPDYRGGANVESLNEARANFREHGIRGPH